jgi:hypothetical protein
MLYNTGKSEDIGIVICRCPKAHAQNIHRKLFDFSTDTRMAMR